MACLQWWDNEEVWLPILGMVSRTTYFGHFRAFCYARIRTWGNQILSRFIRGLTSIVGITIAVIIFLLTSVLREHPKGITIQRILAYLLAISGSLTLVILSYMAMIRGEIQNSILEMTTAFGFVFITFFNLLWVYITSSQKWLRAHACIANCVRLVACECS